MSASLHPTNCTPRWIRSFKNRVAFFVATNFKLYSQNASPVSGDVKMDEAVFYSTINAMVFLIAGTAAMNHQKPALKPKSEAPLYLYFIGTSIHHSSMINTAGQ